MRVFHRSAMLTLGLMWFFPQAAAQGQQACDVDEGKPSQVARATLAVQMASGAQDPAAVSRQLTSAVRMLTDRGEQMANQVGRNFVLGKALVLWSIQPNVPLVTTRGAVGFATNPQGTVDLAVAIDSAFKVVEAAHPECIVETSRWRGQKAWVDLVNVAIERMNADDTDSARTVAERAILLNPYAPYGYVVLANVMQKSGNAAEAFQLYRRAVDAAKRDTSFAEIGRQSLLYLGNLAADSAELAADASARQPYVTIARTAFDEILNDPEAGEMGSHARAGLCRVAIVVGDTAQLRQTYAAPLANPASFSYSDLMSAGVCMARAEMVPEATAMFLGAYERNPFHRDALSNLSIMYLQRDDFDRALPLAVQLEKVEPNNPENLQLLVLSYAGIAKRASDARRAGTRPAAGTKAPARPATPAAPRLSQAAADSLFRIEQAYTDSAVKANERKENLKFRVSLSDFTTTEERSTVAGTVTNTGTDAKPVSVTVEFLDRGGNVVQAKSQDLGSVGAGDSSRFSITVNPGTNIAAFRYKRIE
jgi:tetratricopeptide (TPR) repeat protein